MLSSLFLSSAFAITPLWVYAPSKSDVQKLQGFPLGFAEQRRGPWLRMDADEQGMNALREANIPFTVAPILNRSVPEGYHSPAEMNQKLLELSINHPENSQLYSIGYSENGREILGIRIGNSTSNALSFRILGAHHGDELPSGELVLAFAEELLTRNDTEILDLLDRANIMLVPHVNPDGVESVRRYNSNNVDLNRNYGYMWNSNEYRPGDGPFSEVETQNIRQLGYWHHAAAALSLHAGATNIGWVWNYTTERSTDDIAVAALASDYASSCTQNDFWITNGADWYVTYGDTTDWAYGAHGVFDFTLEVSSSKQPPSNQLPRILSDHLPAMERFVKWPYWGSVTVVDSETGNAITASIIDSASQTAHVGDPSGHVSLLFSQAGNHVVDLAAPGYQTQTITINAGSSIGPIGLDPLDLSDLVPEERVFTIGNSIPLYFESTELVAISEGQEAQTLTMINDQWRLNAGDLRPGTYHLEHDSGITRNAILLESQDSGTSMGSVDFFPDSITFSADNLGAGSTAWGVTTENRNLIRLELEETSTDEFKITFPEQVVLDTQMTFLYSSGNILALAESNDNTNDSGGLDDTAETDQPSAEPTNEPETPSPDSERYGNEESLKVGCQTTPIQLPFVLPLLILGIRRR